MSNNIPGVNKASGPEGGEASASPRPPQPEGYFVNSPPADVLDQARLAVRNATYPNSTVEAAYIAAVDEAVFERVRPLEQLVVGQAKTHVARGKESVENAEKVLAELEAIRDDLRRGKDSAELTRRYTRLRYDVEKMRSVQQSYGKLADTLRTKIADPVAATQKVIAMMPVSSFNPITPRFDR